MSDVYEGSYADSGPTGQVGYSGPSYSGLWRSWTVKQTERYAEAEAAAWLGAPGQAVQHMADWGAIPDVAETPGGQGSPRAGAGGLQTVSDAHGSDNTAVGRQLLGAGHVWADPPPATLEDHQAYPVGFDGGGVVSGDDYDGQNRAQHDSNWGDEGDNDAADGRPAGAVQPPPTDINYPASGHQTDRGEIASKQRRQPRRMQAADEVDTSERYRFEPPRAGGSDAQLRYAHFSDPQLNAPAVQHERGVEGTRAAGPARSWNANSDHVSTRNRRWVERRIPGVHFWRHDMRPVFWRVAKSAAVTAPGTTHQTSPFPAGPGLSRTTVMTQPLLRRTPPPWDLTAASDGTPDTADPGPDPGMWSDFGGL